MEGVKECRIERWLDDEGGWERTDIRVGCGIEGRRDVKMWGPGMCVRTVLSCMTVAGLAALT